MSLVHKFKTSGVSQLYTDGSGNGGWACILVHNALVTERSGVIPGKPTNNRCELMGAIQGFRLCTEFGLTHQVICLTDSAYVTKGATAWIHSWKRKGWVTSKQDEAGNFIPVANRDLWEELDLLMQQHRAVFKWVRGHSGNFYNERCDLLAAQAAKP